jgi:hypothetical protein
MCKNTPHPLSFNHDQTAMAVFFLFRMENKGQNFYKKRLTWELKKRKNT